MGFWRWLFGTKRGATESEKQADSSRILRPHRKDRHRFSGPACGYAFRFTAIHEDELNAPDAVLDGRIEVPKEKGVYGWYFDELPGIPELDYYRVGQWTLLYIGIVPKSEKYPNRTLRDRVRGEHLKGKVTSSTLRLTLAYLLREDLSLDPGARDASPSSCIGSDGEKRLTDWMAKHARVNWMSCEQPWTVEKAALRIYGDVLPLNIDGNEKCAFADQLQRERTQWRSRNGSSWT